MPDGALDALLELMDREDRARALKILARSLCKDLAAQGFDERAMLVLASELVGEVTARLAAERVVAWSQRSMAPAANNEIASPGSAGARSNADALRSTIERRPRRA